MNIVIGHMYRLFSRFLGDRFGRPFTYQANLIIFGYRIHRLCLRPQ